VSRSKFGTESLQYLDSTSAVPFNRDQKANDNNKLQLNSLKYLEARIFEMKLVKHLFPLRRPLLTTSWRGTIVLDKTDDQQPAAVNNDTRGTCQLRTFATAFQIPKESRKILFYFFFLNSRWIAIYMTAVLLLFRRTCISRTLNLVISLYSLQIMHILVFFSRTARRRSPRQPLSRSFKSGTQGSLHTKERVPS
jgi:hypothetical protein